MSYEFKSSYSSSSILYYYPFEPGCVHVAATFDGTYIGLYLNGTGPSAAPFQTNASAVQNLTFLGHTTGAYLTYDFLGIMDELFIYDRVDRLGN